MVIAKLLLIRDGNLCSIRVRWIERVAGKAGRIMTRKAPDILEVTEQRFEELLQRAESNTLRDDDMELMRQIFTSYRGFFQMVGDKNTTIARLRKMMFGATTEKSTNVIGDPATDGANNDDAQDFANVSSGDVLQNTSADGETNKGDDSSEPSFGHGRLSADEYRGADQIDVKHPSLVVGDACPDCGQGKLYEKTPGVLVRFTGQAALHATVYRRQKLRCHLCGKLFTAPIPADVGDSKYDHTVASMIGLLKYGSGLPFNRLQRLQGNFEIPLAASTQWDIVHAAAALMSPAYQELIRQAAQGEVVYNDDTTIRILELMGEHARKTPPAESRLTYHQTHSGPTVDELRTWLQRQFDDKLVEPNSALGEAIKYLLKRWQPLTLFLRKAGAPLDNNLCERALKKAILHRKNSMFYKTRNGARVGDMLMSLIYTCELSATNAFEYLNQLQLNAEAVKECPTQWMPWNYREHVKAVSDAA